MQLAEYRSRYDSLASEEAWFEIPSRKEYLLKQIGRGRRVLDVGCLGGQLTEKIATRGNQVWAIEVNEKAAQAAKARGLTVTVADVEKGIPFETASFDVVHAGDLLDHLYDTDQFMRECGRVLKSNGVLLFSTPNLNSLENRLRVLRGGYLSTAGAFPEDHFGERIRVFNIPKIRELCARSGFELEEVVGVPSIVSRGRWMDLGLRAVGRMLPGLSGLLIVKARRISALH